MARIREPLTLEDRFSGPLENYIKKMEQAATETDTSKSSIVQVSDATQDLVNRLLPLQSAFQESFTENEASRNIDQLISQMERLGLVWTSTEAETHAADLIMNDGLQELANQGMVTADAVARAAYEERAAKQAAKQAAQEEKIAAKQAADEKRAAEKMSAQAAKQAAKEEKAAAEEAARAQEQHARKVDALKGRISGLFRSIAGTNKAQKAYDGLGKQFTRFALTLFSVSRIFNFLKSSLERAPKSIQNSWNAAGTSISNLLGGVVVSALQGLQPSIDRLNAALNSEAGQKLARGLETLANVGGQALGFLLDKVSQLVEFIGNNFQTVMTVAAILVGVFAAQMLLAAASMVVANLPLILFIGLIVSVVTGLMAAGITAQEVFSGIGSVVGWLYAFIYNLVADLWNQFSVFAEFFANVFNDPVAAVAHLFFDTFDNILGVVETVAGAIDALLGSNLAGAVSGFRTDLQNWVNDTFGENEIKVDRMEKLSYENVMADFAEKGAGLADSLSEFSLENALAAPLSPKLDDISGSVKNIEKSVSMTDEDIKALVDVAERRYVNNINLTAQTPVITVNGQNTGNTDQDRRALADAIDRILKEEWASTSVRGTTYA